MTFEGLLPFILLFVMWGASRILLKMARTNQKEQAAADLKPGFRNMLQQHLAVLEPPHQPRTIEPEMKSLIERAEDSQQQESAMIRKKTVSVSPPVGVVKPAILRKKPLGMINSRKLQNAIIWAEILAPPVALRDQ